MVSLTRWVDPFLPVDLHPLGHLHPLGAGSFGTRWGALAALGAVGAVAHRVRQPAGLAAVAPQSRGVRGGGGRARRKGPAAAEGPQEIFKIFPNET